MRFLIELLLVDRIWPGTVRQFVVGFPIALVLVLLAWAVLGGGAVQVGIDIALAGGVIALVGLPIVGLLLGVLYAVAWLSSLASSRKSATAAAAASRRTVG